MSKDRIQKVSRVGNVRPRKVIAALRLNGAVGRNMLVGVFRHLGGSGNWDLRLAQSILQAITRTRLEEVKRRLRETKTSIKAISSACGFPDANYLKILFRRHEGLTMREYRRGS